MTTTRPGFEDLRGRRVLVTGASSGIGAAVAKGFGACGAHVGVQYNRSGDAANALVAAIAAAGGRAKAFHADITLSLDRQRLVEEAAGWLGGLDVLVNNAGGIGSRTPFVETDDAYFDAIFDLNIRSVVSLTRACVPALRAAGASVVINTSSLAARSGGGPGTTIYAASKGAINSLSLGLAKELGPLGIRVNVVSPGAIVTPLHDDTPAAHLDNIRRQSPLGRLGTPDDCVGSFLFFASPSLAGYISGAVLEISGGRV